MREDVVFTNGCFDILHAGHVRMLQFARSLGTKLIVGVDSDNRVSVHKGNSRPVNNAEDRVEVLRALECVDNVHVFGTDEELEELIKKNKTQILVVGADWKGRRVIGEQLVDELVFFPRIERLSTTNIIRKIRQE